MSILINQLKEYGCDIDEAMGRFLDNEPFYEKCFIKFLGDTTFEGLGVALENELLQESFDMAHNLKGVSANLGITPLYAIVEDLVEHLRSGNMPADRMESYNKILSIRDELKRMAGQ